jgi:hypothetical protein
LLLCQSHTAHQKLRKHYQKCNYYSEHSPKKKRMWLSVRWAVSKLVKGLAVRPCPIRLAFF